ncbi:DUF2382 domain-containing protein [Rathayibacter sp. VKM Ac-2759]|uniref:YsnF/AvaK domain-containing protein n=1 Tax=Rathayibacter sp. VKM Ac-2759 TaxID=2609252 RepID=UPI0013167276|nr:YsnF/AvaK domain-containing protein [Rathayibacter sp. VKM Ac-2759]QHC67322.1 DUF2382 domain-containing protein [Rathayibacter sp. VKM Ac-2759]
MSDPVSVIRSEERLEVTTVRTATERVRIRRVIVTEERTVTVPLRREELVIEREPLDGAVGDSPATDPITLILHAEEPVITTRVVPVERVSVIVDRITAMRTVTDSVRKERVDVQRSVSALLDENAE